MLELINIDYEKESYNVNQPDEDKNKILMDILELNELVDEITNSSEVKELEDKLFDTMKPFKNQLERAFLENRIEDVIKIISKMKYYQNVFERLGDLKLKFNLSDA